MRGESSIISLKTEYVPQPPSESNHVVLEHVRKSGDHENAVGLLKQIEEPISQDLRGRCTVKPLVRTEKPHEAIIEQAKEAQADAVIMGVRRRNALDLAIFGSTTHREIQLGPCPVLAVQV